MLSLHQLRCFLTVYEHGSLTAAAEELGYAQPSISEQIRTLERSIGLQLFRPLRLLAAVVPGDRAGRHRPAGGEVIFQNRPLGRRVRIEL